MSNQRRPAVQPEATISLLAEIRCCGVAYSISREQTIPTSTGAAFIKLPAASAACDLCGAEFEIGYESRSREESMASEVFAEVAPEQLDPMLAQGIGGDPDENEMAAELTICAGCDARVDSSAMCNGCREYVCAACRKYEPRGRGGRHQAHDHWTAPKAKKGDSEDGGMVGDEADFVPDDGDGEAGGDL